jgi:D-methionine transport system ATP-binding protein
MILTKNLCKKYKLAGQDFIALKDINLQVNHGEIYGIIGKSGAGKSTLLRTINGLEKPTSGKVLVDGKEINTLNSTEQRKAKSKIGMIFQHFNLMQSKTVWGNIALPLELMHWSKENIKTRVAELLNLVELSNFAEQTPQKLSGGQKQRVAIARALANNPSLLLCDEATSALDPTATKSILNLLKEINQKLKLTIFLITHEMDVVKSICDQVAVIDNGELIEQNDIVSIFTKPRLKVTQDFVHHASYLEIPSSIKEKMINIPGQSTGSIVQISYHGDVADEPIISKLQKAYKIQVNILQGKIETVQNQTLGHLLVEIQGDQSAQLSSIDYLKKNGLTIKTLGYVQRNFNSTN